MSKTGIYRLVQSVRSRIDSPLTHGHKKTEEEDTSMSLSLYERETIINYNQEEG